MFAVIKHDHLHQPELGVALHGAAGKIVTNCFSFQKNTFIQKKWCSFFTKQNQSCKIFEKTNENGSGKNIGQSFKTPESLNYSK